MHAVADTVISVCLISQVGGRGKEKGGGNNKANVLMIKVRPLTPHTL